MTLLLKHLLMTAKTKANVKEILFSSLTTKEGKRELSSFSGRTTSHISELVNNYKIGKANIIGIIIMEYKLSEIKKITKDKKILDIIDKDIESYTDDEISLLSGLNKSVINNLRRYITEKPGSYGFKFHALTLKIEQIAKLANA